MRHRKYRKPRKAHRVWLVICEGETEEAYINLLKRHYRLPITIKTKVLGNSVNARLVNQYITELGTSREECQVIYVYDGDVASVTDKIIKLEGRAIISTPCIEVWFMLHGRGCRQSYSAEGIVRELCDSHKVWKNYVKGTLNIEQSRFLIDQKDVAIKRSIDLEWLANPSSNMHEFLSMLENEKILR